MLDVSRNLISSVLQLTPLAMLTDLSELRLKHCPIETDESHRANVLSVLTQLRMLDDISASVKHDIQQIPARPLTARGRAQ